MSEITDDRLAKAVAYHNGAWPEQLTSGVMFFDGLRITRAEFERIAGGHHE